MINLAMLLATGSPANAGTTNIATVNPNLVLVDNFEGWGTSLCWWANVVGGYANRSTYASLAFTSLELNIVRYNIGGGENPGISNTMSFRAQMQGFEPTNGVWDWSADANQRWMLRQAVALGANRVEAFANSPPWWMTVSGSVTGNAGLLPSNNLQTGYETNFASYLATVVSNLTVLDGIHFDFVTPMNEPSGWWKLGRAQEGCNMSVAQQARVANDLRSALNSQNIAAGIDASEDYAEQDTINDINGYGSSKSNVTLWLRLYRLWEANINGYGSSKSNVTLITTHTYFADNPGGIHNLSVSLGKPAWVSEYGDGDATGLTMAQRIHDDITGAQVSAWIYWQVVDSATGWGFLKNPLNGNGNTAYTINEKFYVMEQFSRYIRPGFQIIGINDTNSLVAYNSTNQTLVIVAVNGSTNNLNVTYNLGSFATLPTRASAVQTSPSENLAGIAAIAVTNNSFSTSLVPQSVTTFVLTNVTPAFLAWYPFEGNAQDASGNGYNGTLSNGVTFVAGKIGAFAAQFNGSNSFVQIPLMISNDFTISFWLKTTDNVGSGQWWNGKGLVDGEVSGTMDDFGVSLVGGHIGLGIGNPDTTVTTTNLVNDGQWHHVAATRDAGTGQMLVYVDGNLQASGIGPTGTRASPPALRIGSIQAGYAGGFLNGAIDDVQIFGCVVPASAIVLLMNHPPVITSLSGTYNILAGCTLILTNTATDPDSPAQTLTWSLIVSPPAGASINSSNGVFSWRPSIAQSPSASQITVQVSDDGTPVMSATQKFIVVVSSPQAPVLSAPTVSNGIFSMLINGDSGPDYVLQSSTNLTASNAWVSVFTNSQAVPPFSWTDSSVTAFPEKFYRVLLGP